jgi:ABC-2 type transport system ATP-binding protein
MDKGKLIFDGLLNDLKERWGDGTEVVFQFKQHTTIEQVRVALGDNSCDLTAKNSMTIRVRMKRRQELLPHVLSTVMASFDVADVKVQEASTEEIVRNIYSTDGGVLNHG